MSDYIEQWLDIIENMSNDNTYKLAWGRAILELILETEEITDKVVFTFTDIAKKMLKYYWNQLDFFTLKQGPNVLKKPVIVQETEKCIAFVHEKENSSLPIWFDRAELVLKQDMEFYNKRIKMIATTLGHDVSWRFMNVNGNTYPLYELDRKKKEISLTCEQVNELKEYAFVLSQLLNYRWALLLEKFNHCPKIASKVKGLSDAKIRRKSLKKYKDILLEQKVNGKIIDFYTGEVIDENDISIDHVIPWSFMYSDDIWNLVITTKSTNSKKSNRIPNDITIKRLEKRNQELLNVIHDNQKYYQELKCAIDNNFVQKFYYSCRL